jgi:hypothetical protein
MDKITLPKGTVVKLNGLPCQLIQDTEVYSATIAGMGLEAFLRWSEDGQQSEAVSNSPTDTAELYS